MKCISIALAALVAAAASESASVFPSTAGEATQACVTQSFNGHTCPSSCSGMQDISSAAITTADECVAACCADPKVPVCTYAGFNAAAKNRCIAGDWHKCASCKRGGDTTFLVNFGPTPPGPPPAPPAPPPPSPPPTPPAPPPAPPAPPPPTPPSPGPPSPPSGPCPACDGITDQTVCQAGRHPTLVGPHNAGCGPHYPPGAVYCAWNSTVGKVTTPGCSNCSAALGMQMAYEFCRTSCVYSGPNPVVLQGCSLKGGPTCKTDGPNGGPTGNYQWACYNPNSVNANHTAWKPGSRDYCRANEEIKGILEQCKPHKGGCMDGGCPPPYPPSPSPSPPPYGL